MFINMFAIVLLATTAATLVAAVLLRIAYDAMRPPAPSGSVPIDQESAKRAWNASAAVNVAAEAVQYVAIVAGLLFMFVAFGHSGLAAVLGGVGLACLGAERAVSELFKTPLEGLDAYVTGDAQAWLFSYPFRRLTRGGWFAFAEVARYLGFSLLLAGMVYVQLRPV